MPQPLARTKIRATAARRRLPPEAGPTWQSTEAAEPTATTFDQLELPQYAFSPTALPVARSAFADHKSSRKLCRETAQKLPQDKYRNAQTVQLIWDGDQEKPKETFTKLQPVLARRLTFELSGPPQHDAEGQE